MELFYTVMNTDLGSFTLICNEYGLTELRFGVFSPDMKVLNSYWNKAVCTYMKQDEHPILLRAKQELSEYFTKKRTHFEVPLHIEGTEFQKRVWKALTEIPYGETRTYGQIAEAIGNPKAVRAVGMANHCNPISIFIPCHRVLGKDGSLTGYAGGLHIKSALLELERQNKS